MDKPTTNWPSDSAICVRPDGSEARMSLEEMAAEAPVVPDTKFSRDGGWHPEVAALQQAAGASSALANFYREQQDIEIEIRRYERGYQETGEPIAFGDAVALAEGIKSLYLSPTFGARADYIAFLAGRCLILKEGQASCPKAIAGIGGLPDTVLDRSIVVNLTRRLPGASLAHWRDRDRTAIEELRRKLGRWCEDNAANIVAGLSGVTFPPGLHDRGRDAWEALLAIGDVAGSDWSGRDGRAWKACEHVTASTADEETGAREMVLADLHTIFKDKDWPEAIGTNQVLEDLIAMEARPWNEWKRGKPLTARGLSSLLKPFRVQPRQRKHAGENLRSYLLADLAPPFEAYFPDNPPVVSATPLPSFETRDLPHSPSATPEFAVADTDRTKPCKTRDGSGVADRNRGAGIEDAPAPVKMPSQPSGTSTAGEAYRRRRDGE